jgi:uncharacterized protein
MCHGGCPKYRFIRTPAGEAGLNYLCAGLKRFFLHSRAPLARMAAREREREQAPGPRAAPGKVGRNDPCPCGSGLKFKKCGAAR